MIKYTHMHYFKYILGALVVIGFAVLTYQVNALSTRIDEQTKRADTQEKAIKEIAGVITQGGLVVPDKDGKAMVNPLLLEAWKQANALP